MSAFGGRPQHNVHDEDSELRNQQLHYELERPLLLAPTTDISLPGSCQTHNPTCLGQLSLPPERLLQVLSYVVVLPGDIHVCPPYDDIQYRWRLSLCPESSFKPCWSSCRYPSGRPGGTVADYMDTTPRYIDTALLLVSRAMRHTTLDILFTRNHFVFSYRYDLPNFASKFPLAAARIQSLRLCYRVDDSSSWDPPAENVACTRRLFKSLRHLELNVLLDDSSPYESIHEDGFLKELCHFRRPLPESFKCSVQWVKGARYGGKLGLDEGVPELVREKLIKIFTGVYGDEIPISTPPPRC